MRFSTEIQITEAEALQFQDTASTEGEVASRGTGGLLGTVSIVAVTVILHWTVTVSNPLEAQISLVFVATGETEEDLVFVVVIKEIEIIGEEVTISHKHTCIPKKMIRVTPMKVQILSS